MKWNIIESESGIHYPGINLQFLIRDNSSLCAQNSLCLVMVHVFVQGYTARYNSIPLFPFPSCDSTSCPRYSAFVFYHQSICRFPISKSYNSRRKLPKLVSNHIFRDRHLKIILSIVNLKLQADKIGQNGRGSGLCSNGRDFVSSTLGPDNGETIAS